MAHNPKSLWQRITATVLAILLVVGMTPAIFAATPPDEPGTINLVSFGDSMTNGYGHLGYKYGTDRDTSHGQVNGFRQNDVTTTYPAFLKAYFEELGYDVNWEALAVSCMRTEDVNFLLRFHTDDAAWADLAAKLTKEYGGSTDDWDGSVKALWEERFVDDGKIVGDFFTFNEFVTSRVEDWGNNGNPDENAYPWQSNPTLAYAKYYQNAVKNADVLALGTGNANFGVIMLQNITGLLTGNTFGSGFRDEVPVDEVIDRNFGNYAGDVRALLAQANVAAKQYLAVLPEEKSDKILQIVEHTVLSFMVSYMDMLDAIEELNEKEKLDVLMMGLMNTMDGIVLDMGDGTSLDLGSMIDSVTDVLSEYYFTIPVLRQMKEGKFANFNFYAVPNDDHIEMLVSDMASVEDIKNNDTMRDRMITSISGKVFDLLRPVLADAEFELGTGLTREQVEDYEAVQAAYGEVDYATALYLMDLMEDPSSVLGAAIYTAIEQAVSDNADNATLDMGGLMALMGGMDGLGAMFMPLAAAVNFPEAEQAEIGTAVETAVTAMISAGGDPNAQAIYAEAFTAIEMTRRLSAKLYAALSSDDAASLAGLLSLFARMIIGDGIGSHPNENGHKTLFAEIMRVYPDHPATERIELFAAYVSALVEENGPAVLRDAYEFAKAQGIIPAEESDAAIAFVSDLVNALEASSSTKETLDIVKAAMFEIYTASGKSMEEIASYLLAVLGIVATADEETIASGVAALAEKVYDEKGKEGLVLLVKLAATYLDEPLKTLFTENAERFVDNVEDFASRHSEDLAPFYDAIADEFVNMLWEKGILSEEKIGFALGVLSVLKQVGAYAITADEESVAADVAALVSLYGPSVLSDLYAYAIEQGVLPENSDEIAAYVEEAVKALTEADTIEEYYEIVKDLVIDAAEQLKAAGVEFTFEEIKAFVEAVASYIVDANPRKVVKDIAELAEAAFDAYGKDGIMFLANFASRYVDASYRQTFLEVMDYMADEILSLAGKNYENLTEAAWQVADELFDTFKAAGYFNDTDLAFTRGHILALKRLCANIVAACEAGVPEAVLAAVQEIAATAPVQEILAELQSGMTVEEIINAKLGEAAAALDAILSEKAAALEEAAAEKLAEFEALVEEETFLDADDVAAIEALIPEIISALVNGDEDAALAACEELVETVYTAAVENGAISDEVLEAIDRVVTFLESPEEIIADQLAYAEEKLAELVDAYGSAALEALEEYLAAAEEWLPKEELAAIEALIEKYADNPEAALADIAEAVYEAAVEAGLISEEDVAAAIDAVNEVYAFIVAHMNDEITLKAVNELLEAWYAVYTENFTDPTSVEIQTYLAYVSEIIKLVYECDPEEVKAAVEEKIAEAKATFEALKYAATHGVYYYNEEGILVILGGDTATGRNIDRDDTPYFDTLKEYYEIAARKSLAKSDLQPWEIYDYVLANIDEIADADFITYELDSVALLVALFSDSVDWTDYLDEEYVDAIDSVMETVKEIILTDLPDYVDVDPAEVAAAVRAAAAEALTEAISSIDWNLNELVEDDVTEALDTCIAWVNSLSDGVSELLADVLEKINEVLSDDWNAYVAITSDEILDQIRNEVIALYEEEFKAPLEAIDSIVSANIIEAIDTTLNFYSEIVELLLPVNIEAYEYVVRYQVQLKAVVDGLDSFLLWTNWLDSNDIALMGKIVKAVYEVLSADWLALTEVEAEAVAAEAKEAVLEALWENVGKDAAAIAENCEAEVESLVDFVVNYVQSIVAEQQAAKEELLAAVNEALTVEIPSAEGISAEGILAAVDAYIASLFDAFTDSVGDAFESDVEDLVAGAVDLVKGALAEAEDVKRSVIGNPDEETVDLMFTLAERLVYALVASSIDTVKAVNAIREVNPDATFAVIGMYNPIRGLSVKNGDEIIDLGEYADYVVDATNFLYTIFAIANGEFTFVAVPDTATEGFDTVIDLETMDLTKVALLLLTAKSNMLANAEGHAYIAEQVINAIEFIKECEHEWEYEYDEDGHWTVCTKCGEETEAEAHVYDDEHDLYCNECGYKRIIIGDFDEDGYVDKDDSVYLLYYTQFPDDPDYALNQNGDYDGDGLVTRKDAVYHLYHTFYGEEEYPLVRDSEA